MPTDPPRPMSYPSMAGVRQEQVIYQLEVAERALLLVRTLLGGQGAGERIASAHALLKSPPSDDCLRRNDADMPMTPEDAVKRIGEELQQVRAMLLRSQLSDGKTGGRPA